MFSGPNRYFAFPLIFSPLLLLSFWILLIINLIRIPLHCISKFFQNWLLSIKNPHRTLENSLFPFFFLLFWFIYWASFRHWVGSLLNSWTNRRIANLLLVGWFQGCGFHFWCRSWFYASTCLFLNSLNLLRYSFLKHRTVWRSRKRFCSKHVGLRLFEILHLVVSLEVAWHGQVCCKIRHSLSSVHVKILYNEDTLRPEGAF